MVNIPKFKCRECGECCSNMQGFVSDTEKEFMKEYAYGKLPLIQLVPPNEATFPLWDFEAKRFLQYEKESKKKAGIVPLRGVLDLKSQQFIVFSYQMTAVKNVCPFLKDSKCSIYKTPRAFICHLFPFVKSPFLSIGEEDKNLFGNCKKLKGIKTKLNYKNDKKLIPQLYKSFGDIFLASVQHDLIMDWANRLIVELINDSIIEPAMNMPYELLLMKIDKVKKIDLMDFLVKSKYLTKDEVTITRKRFENYQDAKEKIIPLL